MTDDSYRDRIVEEVTEKVTQRPAIDADKETVQAKTEKAVDGLIDAPLQTFTSLLAENEVLSDLHGGSRTEAAGEHDSARPA